MELVANSFLLWMQSQEDILFQCELALSIQLFSSVKASQIFWKQDIILDTYEF